MSDKKDLQKVYAIQNTLLDNTYPEDASEEHFTVPYLDHEGKLREVHACLYMPAAEKPVPLVYVSHYKIMKDSYELCAYLREGWAVGCVYEAVDPNSEVTRDCLISNSAVLWNLRHRKEIDGDRVAVTGGSAGGYMGMMLSALHLFPCCTSVKGAFANPRFNFNGYSQYVSELNLPAILKLPEEKRSDIGALIAALPVPFAIVFNLFRTPEVGARLENPITAAAVSPVCLADCYSAPLMEFHSTGDVLVPVDQITHSFAYPQASEDLPADYKMHLADYDLSGDFARSFTEMLTPGTFTEWKLGILAEGEVKEAEFDEKPFQIEILDDGAPIGRGGHESGRSRGIYSDLNFLRTYMRQGNRNGYLTDAKLRLLIREYAGGSIQLPAHPGNVYGCEEIYRQEVVEELKAYFGSHPQEDAPKRFEIFRRDPALSAAAEACLKELTDK